MQLNDLPSRRAEAWKWTDLRAAMSDSEEALSGSGPMAPLGPIATLAELFGDGPSELVIETKGETFENRQEDGDAGQYGKIIARAGSEATLVERIGVTGVGMRNILPVFTEIEVEPGAKLTRIVVQENAVPVGEASAAIVLNETVVKLGKGASYRQFILGEGSKLTRIETSIVTAGEGAEIELNGVYLAGAKRHVDLTSRVTHGAAGGVTRQLVRGVARKGGRGVFQGRFLVERAAQKTDARMAHNALLLEEGAEVFAKPELEIYADDVACAHGNTAGRLDEDAVFYLRQRGLPEVDARAMITRAFLMEALPEWLADVRAEVETRIDAWLGTSGAGTGA
jgi:Fe-S cluster assembly protein SufD